MPGELDMQLFEEWIKRYQKRYSSEDERKKRFKAFQQSVREKEAEQNRPKFSLTLKDTLNPFFDMSFDDFMRELMGCPDGADHEISDEDDEDLRCGFRIVIDRTVKSEVPVLIYTRTGNDVPLKKAPKPQKKGCDDVPKQAVKPQKPCCDDDDDAVDDDPDEETVKPQKTCCCDDDDADHDDPDEEAVKPQKTCCDDDDDRDEEAVKRERAGNDDDDDDVPKQAVKQQKTGCDEKDTKGPMEAPEEEP